jgi:hypothetical protein
MKQPLKEALELQIEAYQEQVLLLKDKRVLAYETGYFSSAAEHDIEIKTMNRVITDLKRLI